jgi:hypothetical protein
MPPPSEQSQPDFDEVRRKADEFARHAYPDVFARFERIRSGLDVNFSIVSAIIEREHKPTVCLSVTSGVAYTYGYGDDKIGPTRCALCDKKSLE